MEKYFNQFKACRQREKPFCSDRCPFHLDVLDFQQKMAGKRFNTAYKTFRNAVGFPDIVARLCPQYCAEVCPRAKTDAPVQLNLLERTCVAKAKRKDPTDYNLPAKTGKVAIAGAGISGLGCALRLLNKKFNVTIYEKSDRIGGQLWDLLEPELFLEDIERQLKYETYDLQLNMEITDLDTLRQQGFQVVYVATGSGGPDFGALQEYGGHGVARDGMAIFAGGGLAGKDVMQSLADGLSVAWAIEVFLQTGKLEYPQPEPASTVVVDESRMEETDPVQPTENGLFTEDEAAAEAARCIRCQCDGCRNRCDISAFTEKWPLQMRDEIMTTVMASASMVHKTPAIRTLNMCTSCRLCDDVCPAEIELGEMIREGRRRLHNLGRMPGAYHQFWVRDMDFANGDKAALARCAPLQQTCDWAFFPGCHLGAANPDYVHKPYRWLRSRQPETGLLLRCCGVPADWAGNEAAHQRAIADLRADWESMGKPGLILACASCRRHLNEFLPEIRTVSLYEMLNGWGFTAADRTTAADPTDRPYTVFDPCSARHDEPMRQAVRRLAETAGLTIHELPDGAEHGCCGFGGHTEVANPEFAAYVTKKRAALSPEPYLVYCSNCRDVFLDDEKPARHILDVLFEVDAAQEKRPDLTKRRQNRTALKEAMLKEIWRETMEKSTESCSLNLRFAPEVREKMHRIRVLEEDVCDVIRFSERTRRRTFNRRTGVYTCYREQGHITTWVEYRVDGEVYEVLNVYTHRMKIDLEAVWNGRKTDTDLR